MCELRYKRKISNSVDAINVEHVLKQAGLRISGTDNVGYYLNHIMINVEVIKKLLGINAKNTESLMEIFTANKSIVISHLEEVIKTTRGLSGQWSVDIIQSGGKFYFIDMATAATSAFKEKINYDFGSPKEDWMPIIDRKE